MRRLQRWGARAILAVGVWWLLVTCTPLVLWWASQLAKPWGNGEGAVLVVLAGEGSPDSIIGLESYWRTVYTVRAMRRHPFERVIVCGGGVPVPLSELIRDFIAGHGISTANVVVETKSGSTDENVRNVAQMLRDEKGKIVMLTSDYHVWRAQRVFARQGIRVEPWPVPDVLKRGNSWWLRAGLFFDLCRESAKIGWYKWKGWI